MSWRKEVHIISCNSWAEKLLLRFLSSGKKKNFNKYLEWKVRDELKNVNASVYKVKHVSVFNCIFLLRIFHAAFFLLISRLKRSNLFLPRQFDKIKYELFKTKKYLSSNYLKIYFLTNKYLIIRKDMRLKKEINTY